uniref:Uncharacterized protein n=1 Tax=Arundo donax TaxID=35708 RepID=A0A0A9CNK5_ARUDO
MHPPTPHTQRYRWSSENKTEHACV